VNLPFLPPSPVLSREVFSLIPMCCHSFFCLYPGHQAFCSLSSPCEQHLAGFSTVPGRPFLFPSLHSFSSLHCFEPSAFSFLFLQLGNVLDLFYAMGFLRFPISFFPFSSSRFLFLFGVVFFFSSFRAK